MGQRLGCVDLFGPRRHLIVCTWPRALCTNLCVSLATQDPKAPARGVSRQGAHLPMAPNFKIAISELLTKGNPTV